MLEEQVRWQIKWIWKGYYIARKFVTSNFFFSCCQNQYGEYWAEIYIDWPKCYVQHRPDMHLLLHLHLLFMRNHVYACTSRTPAPLNTLSPSDQALPRPIPVPSQIGKLLFLKKSTESKIPAPNPSPVFTIALEITTSHFELIISDDGTDDLLSTATFGAACDIFIYLGWMLC